MVKRKFPMLLAVLILILAACGNGRESAENSRPASASGNVQPDGGKGAEKNEVAGTLSFYTSQPDEDAAKLVDAFTEKYPNVKVEIFRSGTEEVVSKILAEKQAGEIQADVLLLADAVTFETLKRGDLLLSYQSPERNHIPSSFADPDGMYTGTKVMATVLAVNTNKVKTMPDSWNVLAGDQAKGQGIMPSPLYSGAAAYNLGVFTRNEGFGWEFYQKLKANGTVVTKGNGAVLKSVASGEKAYGMVVDYLVVRAAKEGSPVALVYPKEGVPVITEPVGIVKNTKNPAAAKALVDFILSEEGQRLQAELGYAPVREGVEAPEGLKGIEELKVLEADLKDLYENREKDKKRFSEIFGG